MSFHDCSYEAEAILVVAHGNIEMFPERRESANKIC